MADHRQPRQRCEERHDPEVFVAGPELLDRRFLVGVGHEVHEALQDLSVELDGVADHLAVARVVLVPEHVHERAVVDPVHPEGPDEVALHQPERLGKEEGVRRLRGDSVDDLAPELVRHQRVEGGLGHRVLAPRRDGATAPGLRPPEPLDVALGKDHRGVESDHRETAGDLEDRLDDRLADVGLEVVQLSRVVPGKARAVVAVVDVADVARRRVAALEDDRGVGVVPVVVFEADLHALVVGQVLARVRVGGERRLGDPDEPIRIVDHPVRIDPHVVGDHVRREPDPARGRPVAQVRVSRRPRRGRRRSGSRRANTRKPPRRRCRASA